jgi:hypothetical protein
MAVQRLSGRVPHAHKQRPPERERLSTLNTVPVELIPRQENISLPAANK